MQALPYATHYWARLGADVVKIEPLTGELGRASLPAMSDPEGRSVGATFLRNNLNKRSMCVDLKRGDGRQLVLDLAPRFRRLCRELSRRVPWTAWARLQRRCRRPPRLVRVGVGLRQLVAAPTGSARLRSDSRGDVRRLRDEAHRTTFRPWYRPLARSGTLGRRLTPQSEFSPRSETVTGRDDPHSRRCNARFRHRDDCIVTNYWSMGVDNGDSGSVINHGFRAADGWFVMQVARVHVFERLAQVVGHPEWVTDRAVQHPLRLGATPGGRHPSGRREMGSWAESLGGVPSPQRGRHRRRTLCPRRRVGHRCARSLVTCLSASIGLMSRPTGAGAGQPGTHRRSMRGW